MLGGSNPRSEGQLRSKLFEYNRFGQRQKGLDLICYLWDVMHIGDDNVGNLGWAQTRTEGEQEQ